MIHIAAENQSSDSLVNTQASTQLVAKVKSRRKSSSIAFVGFSAWRRDEFGDANLFDKQVFVVRDGQVRFLNPRYDLENFSPDGLNWGYAGSGSAQLAVAMLMELVGDWERVKRLWPKFNDEFVTKLPRNANWTADGNTVLAIALSFEARSRTSHSRK
jgi:Family of unknown function (DUF6166)